jgi:hypothetical protein
MNKTRTIWSAMVVGFALCLAAPASRAQESTKLPAQAQEKSITPYRLDFSVNEMEDSKKINSRQYSMNLISGDGGLVKVGTRVAVEAKQGEFQYLDVGTSINARAQERDNNLLLNFWCDISNFALPGQENSNTHPALRQLQINGNTIIPLGKSMVVGSVEDPNSKRQFQLEVTATKLR